MQSSKFHYLLDSIGNYFRTIRLSKTEKKILNIRLNKVNTEYFDYIKNTFLGRKLLLEL
jgi:hypothetical protein